MGFVAETKRKTKETGKKAIALHDEQGFLCGQSIYQKRDVKILIRIFLQKHQALKCGRTVWLAKG